MPVFGFGVVEAAQRYSTNKKTLGRVLRSDRGLAKGMVLCDDPSLVAHGQAAGGRSQADFALRNQLAGAIKDHDAGVRCLGKRKLRKLNRQFAGRPIGNCNRQGHRSNDQLHLARRATELLSVEHQLAASGEGWQHPLGLTNTHARSTRSWLSGRQLLRLRLLRWLLHPRLALWQLLLRQARLTLRYYSPNARLRCGTGNWACGGCGNSDRCCWGGDRSGSSGNCHVGSRYGDGGSRRSRSRRRNHPSTIKNRGQLDRLANGQRGTGGNTVERGNLRPKVGVAILSGTNAQQCFAGADVGQAKLRVVAVVDNVLLDNNRLMNDDWPLVSLSVDALIVRRNVAVVKIDPTVVSLAATTSTGEGRVGCSSDDDDDGQSGERLARHDIYFRVMAASKALWPGSPGVVLNFTPSYARHAGCYSEGQVFRTI